MFDGLRFMLELLVRLFLKKILDGRGKRIRSEEGILDGRAWPRRTNQK
jgi:hypothetical protein